MICYIDRAELGDVEALEPAVLLYLIQKEITEKVGMEIGRMTLIVKSAHFYLRDEEKAMKILGENCAP